MPESTIVMIGIYFMSEENGKEVEKEEKEGRAREVCKQYH